MISLTEKLVFDPVQHFSNPLNDCIESELITRIIGASASFFAIIDIVSHLVGIVAVSGMILAKSVVCICDNKDYNTLLNIIDNLFRFTMVALVGSLMGVLFPNCLIDSFTTNGIVVHQPVNNTSTTSAGGSLAQPIDIDEKKEADELMTLAAWEQAVQDGDEVDPYIGLRQYFSSLSLGGQARFVSNFSEPISQYKQVREELADLVFQPKSIRSVAPVRWLSRMELHDQAEKLSTTSTLKATLKAKGIPWSDNFHKGYFFHGTRNTSSLQAILQCKAIQVRHQGVYKGAFVATIPEFQYGSYFFVFKENIAHNSSLTIASNTSSASYWAGFSQDIPIDPYTIAYIMIDDPANFDSLKKQCKKWAGWDIPVVAYSDIRDHLEELKTLNRGLPSGWPKPTD